MLEFNNPVMDLDEEVLNIRRNMSDDEEPKFNAYALVDRILTSSILLSRLTWMHFSVTILGMWLTILVTERFYTPNSSLKMSTFLMDPSTNSKHD
jgi:hypothetical protein